MSKKPMYLKRRAGSKVAVLLAFALFMLVALYFLPRQKAEPVVEQNFAESVFQGKVEKIVSPKASLPFYYMHQKGGLTAMSFIFTKAGSAYERSDNSGVSGIVAQTLKEGAGWWSAKELRNLTGRSGIKISFAASKDDFSGQLTFPNEYREEAVKYLREMLLNPHFEDKYVDNAKASVIKAIEAQKENPATELDLAFNQDIFGNFAYARNPLGDASSVAGLNRRDLISFVRDNLGKNNLLIGVVGNLTAAEAALMVDDAFSRLPTVTNQDIGEPEINWSKSDLTIQRDIPQNIMLYAAQGTCRQCADFYPLYIANYILGGAGLNSRFNQQLRETENLTYGVSSWLELNDKADLIVASFSATTANIARAKELFKQIWQQAAREGFTAEELQTAKDYLIASHNLRFTSTIGIADMLAYMQKYDLGTDFLHNRNNLIKSVTLQQLNTAARNYFNNDFRVAEIGKINN